MRNYIQPGKMLKYTNSSGSTIASGALISIAGLGAVIAACDILDGAIGDVATEGVFRLAKTTSQAWAFGIRLYWDGTKVTSTKTSNQFIGYCAEAAGSADAFGNVKLSFLGDDDSSQLSQAAVIAALGTTSNLVGVDGTGSNAAPLVGTEARLDAIEAKVDALIAALKTANLMASA